MPAKKSNSNMPASRDAAYQAAIEIIAKGKFDAHTIAVGLAKTAPELFVQLASPVEVSTKYADVARTLLGGNRVESIRLLRSKTGLSLQEAIDIIDHTVIRLRDRGYIIVGEINMPLPRLSLTEHHFVDEIVASV